VFEGEEIPALPKVVDEKEAGAATKAGKRSFVSGDGTRFRFDAKTEEWVEAEPGEAWS
jgi:hypothetical protein